MVQGSSTEGAFGKGQTDPAETRVRINLKRYTDTLKHFEKYSWEKYSLEKYSLKKYSLENTVFENY